MSVQLSKKKTQKDHRRVSSVEDLTHEALSIIIDDDQIDKYGAIQEEKEDSDDDYDPGLTLLARTNSGSMDKMLKEIDIELSGQYTPQSANSASSSKSGTPLVVLSPLKSIKSVSISSPNDNNNNNNNNLSAREHYIRDRNKRQRSDSHYKASTPLVVKKYSLFQLDALIKNKKPQLAKAHELNKLNDVTDIAERHDLLLKKLSLCEVLCDFRLVSVVNDDNIFDITDPDVINEMQSIENKKNMLTECMKYLTKNKWDSVIILQQIFRTIQTNLFRSLPDGYIIREFQGVDQPIKYTLPSWKHLQMIYELFFQVLMNKNIDQNTIWKYLSGQFLNNFVSLFHSLCSAEVDYVKVLVHSMYLDYVDIRDEIRIAISQYCWDYIYYDNGTADGINSILDIMNSILQGVNDDNLNNISNKWFIVLCHVLCPLHKGLEYDKFELSLYSCIKTYIKSNPEYFGIVFTQGIVRFWPFTNPKKEEMFIKQIIKVIKMVKQQKILFDDKFNCVFLSVIDRIRKSLWSKHYRVVDEIIECFKEKLMRQCIEYHGGELSWRSLYKSLIYIANDHYLYLTRDKGKQILDWLKKYRITKKYAQIFDQLEKEYKTTTTVFMRSNGQPVDKNKQQLRENKYKSLKIMADKAKKKLQASIIDDILDDIDKQEQDFINKNKNNPSTVLNDVANTGSNSNLFVISDKYEIDDDKQQQQQQHISKYRRKQRKSPLKSNSILQEIEQEKAIDALLAQDKVVNQLPASNKAYWTQLNTDKKPKDLIAKIQKVTKTQNKVTKIKRGSSSVPYWSLLNAPSASDLAAVNDLSLK